MSHRDRRGGSRLTDRSEDSPAAEPVASEPDGCDAAAAEPVASEPDRRDAAAPDLEQVPARGGDVRGPLRAAATVLAATTLLFVATTAVFAYLWVAQGRRDRTEDEVGTLAARFAKNLVTFDYRTIDADIQRIQRDSTGTFRTQLARALGGEVGVFRDELVEAQANSSGVVHGVVVTTVDGPDASATAFVDQRIRNKDSPEPRIVTRRVRLTLVQTSAGWKVDGVDTREE